MIELTCMLSFAAVVSAHKTLKQNTMSSNCLYNDTKNAILKWCGLARVKTKREIKQQR